MAKKPHAHDELHETITCSSAGCLQKIKLNVIERAKAHNKGNLVPFNCYLHGELEKGRYFVRVGTIKNSGGMKPSGRYEKTVELLARRKRMLLAKA